MPAATTGRSHPPSARWAARSHPPSRATRPWIRQRMTGRSF